MPNLLQNLLQVANEYLIQKPIDYFKNQLDDALPRNHTYFISVRALKKADGSKVGSIIPALYSLAEAGKLECQINEDPRLFRDDGSPKSNLELALSDGNSKKRIEEIVERECQYQFDTHGKLPPHLSKIRMSKELLEDILKQGYLLEDEDVPANNFPINIKGKPELATNRVKILHYVGQWTSWLMSLSAAATVGFATSSFGLFVGCAVAIAAYRVNKDKNDFTMFELAENINHDLGWLTSNKLGLISKFSLKNTLKTLFYLGAIGALGVAGVVGAWSMAMTLPVWPWVSGFGIPALTLAAEVAKYSMAILFTTVAIAGTWASTFPTRYFRGLSFSNENIVTDPETVDKIQPKRKAKKDATRIEELAEKWENLLVKSLGDPGTVAQQDRPTPADYHKARRACDALLKAYGHFLPVPQPAVAAIAAPLPGGDAAAAVNDEAPQVQPVVLTGCQL